jgi:hypothetical protein
MLLLGYYNCYKIFTEFYYQIIIIIIDIIIIIIIICSSLLLLLLYIYLWLWKICYFQVFISFMNWKYKIKLIVLTKIFAVGY